jgi:hypothetical protein
MKTLSAVIFLTVFMLGVAAVWVWYIVPSCCYPHLHLK